MTIPKRNILLSGIVGSTAYGLAHEASDVDRLGLFAVDTVELHGLHQPQESHVQTRPDVTLHEARKWCRLALGCNPTVMELVWLPDELYEVRTDLGNELIDIRQCFLSAPRVRNAYLGYATQQFRKLQSRADGTFGPDLRHRTEKHARHLFRLCMQGLELYTSGQLSITLIDPALCRTFGEAVADDPSVAGDLIQSYEASFDAAQAMGKVALPDKPDEKTVESWLRQVRRDFY